jgi:catechol 2,3-dioxygenase-like lactoylglutathione lyase family enzyme
MSGVHLVFDHVHLISKDPDAAAKWYADILGGTITRRGEVRGALQIAVQCGGVTILVRGQRPGEQPGDKNPLQSFANFVSHNQWGTDHFGFKIVGDLSDFCAAIREKGGTFAVEPYEFAPGTRIAYLAGPDGGEYRARREQNPVGFFGRVGGREQNVSYCRQLPQRLDV